MLEIGPTAAGQLNNKLTSTGELALTDSAMTFALLPGSSALQPGDRFTVLVSSSNFLSLVGDVSYFDPSLSGYSFAQTQTQTAGGGRRAATR